MGTTHDSLKEFCNKDSVLHSNGTKKKCSHCLTNPSLNLTLALSKKKKKIIMTSLELSSLLTNVEGKDVVRLQK